MMFRALALVFGIGACGGAQTNGTPPPTATTTASVTPPAPSAPSVHLVQSTREHDAVPASGVHVTIAPDALFLENTSITALPFTHVTSGELLLPPLATALASSTAKDALVSVDARVPYRTLVEVLYTLSQHEITQYHFVVLHGATPQSIASTPPKLQSLHDPAPGKSDLTVIITHDGFSLKTRGGNIKTGCTEAGPGLAIVNGPSGYDFAALERCRGNLAGTGVMSDAMVLIANPTIDFETVVHTIDALAETFPRVSFGVSK